MATTVNTEVIKQQIIQSSCASSHTEFLMKNKNPLWLNPSFFVSLPFKQNEVVNPTKAKPTTSPWACEAFYVNKKSEQVRAAQPFLADDKFQSLANTKFLANAVLSKFDLEAGFWQLGIQPEDIPIDARSQ
ncbi:hypothetical protein OSB04_003752 [Centaurea solstitialis]|uniref:Reverse transcriptase n=1 Tax=Centaurea solstitialis TaxID=347529 RepID=A0AA38WVT2_9ASTR|nr:hypothetical protein OSB04_003752 [Centaurea solstitialis]